jgi:hypothetical protein
MLYEYLCDRCQTVTERSLPVSSAPALGAKHPCKNCGGDARRVISGSVSFEDAKLKADVHKYPIESISFTGLEGCERGPKGGSMITSPTHRREVCARNGLGWL